MDTKLTERELAAALSDVLDRVRRGERFVVERDGTPLATLVPPAQPVAVGISGRDLVARLGKLRVPDDGFVDEIERARSELPPLRSPQWLG
jgi:antitoxin (DNA-binding transcriptional repressor) of toxin-antitoxin stability system